MIKYKLSCKNCLLSFDSWFSSSKEYEKLKKIKYISCHNCNSTRVNKSLMTPNLSNSKKGDEIKNHKKFNKVKNKIKQYQNILTLKTVTMSQYIISNTTIIVLIVNNIRIINSK